MFMLVFQGSSGQSGDTGESQFRVAHWLSRPISSSQMINILLPGCARRAREGLHRQTNILLLLDNLDCRDRRNLTTQSKLVRLKIDFVSKKYHYIGQGIPTSVGTTTTLL